MKILIINGAYPHYIDKFNQKYNSLTNLNYLEAEKLYYEDHFALTNTWEFHLKKVGIECITITHGHTELNNKISSEKYHMQHFDEFEYYQNIISEFQPSLIWVTTPDLSILKIIRNISIQIPIMGWSGSKIANQSFVTSCDFLLSCAPETVDEINKLGVKCFHLNHSFDPRVLTRVKKSLNKEIPISFIGQIAKGNGLHNKREELLIKLSKITNIKIYSNISSPSSLERSKIIIKKLLQQIGLRNREIIQPINPFLLRKVSPALYGLEMFHAISQSQMSLNIHADSSPTHASNMRLFEATGMNSLLLTDHKNNIEELFEKDKEIITYTSTEECIQKVTFFQKNPSLAKKISQKGFERTYQQHLTEHRVDHFLNIIKNNI